MEHKQAKLTGRHMIEIPISGSCVLMLTDAELMASLPGELLATGIRRGKAIRRRRLFVERESQKDARTAAAVVDR